MIGYSSKLAPSTSRPALDVESIRARLDATPYEFVAPLTGGYSTITCEVRSHSGERGVMRWRPRDAHTLNLELAAAACAASQVNVPEVLHHREDWALLSWVEGTRVDLLLEDDTRRHHWSAIARACGESLAALHTIRFDACGFLTPEMRVGERLGGSGTGLADSMRAWLEASSVRAHLGEDRVKTLSTIIAHHAGSWRQLDEDGARLVHSDFNTKNLIARDDSVRWQATLLDWEYAFAGSRFMDLGNFLRFEHERPEAARAFIEGYETYSEESLPTNWRTLAYLCDLCSMLSMLTRPDLSARTRRTVLGVIDHIIEANTGYWHLPPGT